MKERGSRGWEKWDGEEGKDNNQNKIFHMYVPIAHYEYTHYVFQNVLLIILKKQYSAKMYKCICSSNNN